MWFLVKSVRNLITPGMSRSGRGKSRKLAPNGAPSQRLSRHHALSTRPLNSPAWAVMASPDIDTSGNRKSVFQRSQSTQIHAIDAKVATAYSAILRTIVVLKAIDFIAPRCVHARYGTVPRAPKPAFPSWFPRTYDK